MNLYKGLGRAALVAGVLGALLSLIPAWPMFEDVAERRAASMQFDTLLANPDVSLAVERAKDAGYRAVTVEFEDRLEINDTVKSFTLDPNGELLKFETPGGEDVYPRTRVVPASEYVLPALLPIFGFLIPWVVIMGIRWAASGFFDEPRSSELPTKNESPRADSSGPADFE